ncbi:MAG: hypothetical protein MJ213_02155 [Bacilli bacterium]|nr:hypothetical protein [Bacilli bacterium]
MKCPICGTEMWVDYCPKCGYSLKKDIETDSEDIFEEDNERNNNEEDK